MRGGRTLPAATLRALLSSRTTLSRRALIRTGLAAAALFDGLSSGTLFEILNFLLHVAAGLRVLLGPERVVPAIRAALPTFGIGLLTLRAENTFGKRHQDSDAPPSIPTTLRSARIVHFDPWTKSVVKRC